MKLQDIKAVHRENSKNLRTFKRSKAKITPLSELEDDRDKLKKKLGTHKSMIDKFKEMNKKMDQNEKKLNSALETSLTTASNLKHMVDTLQEASSS